jgi:hypothetical protein
MANSQSLNLKFDTLLPCRSALILGTRCQKNLINTAINYQALKVLEHGAHVSLGSGPNWPFLQLSHWVS